MRKHAQLKKDKFNTTIISLIYSLDETRKKEEVIRFPWERYLFTFFTLTLFFITFDPAGKEYYLPYFIFIFTTLSVLGREDWKKIQQVEEQNQIRRERIKKIIKEEFQHEQEEITKRVHAWKRRIVVELQRRSTEAVERRNQEQTQRRTRRLNEFRRLQQDLNYMMGNTFYYRNI